MRLNSALLTFALLALPELAQAQASTYPRAGFRAQLSTQFHNVHGTVTIVDEDTLLVENFTYDGGGASVFFRLGATDTFGGFLNGISIGPQLLGMVFNNGSLVIDLPAGVTMDGFNAVAVWCVPAQFSFGNGPFAQLPPLSYCTPTLNSQGCTPSIGFSGLPSASSTAPFTIQANMVINQQLGILLYSHGTASTPFAGGTLCLSAPLRRTLVQNSMGGAGGVDCSGIYSIDFGAHIRSGVDPTLVAGSFVCAQYWQRDPQAASGVGLTAGLSFDIAP